MTDLFVIVLGIVAILGALAWWTFLLWVAWSRINRTPEDRRAIRRTWDE